MAAPPHRPARARRSAALPARFRDTVHGEAYSLAIKRGQQPGERAPEERAARARASARPTQSARARREQAGASALREEGRCWEAKGRGEAKVYAAQGMKAVRGRCERRDEVERFYFADPAGSE